MSEAKPKKPRHKALQSVVSMKPLLVSKQDAARMLGDVSLSTLDQLEEDGLLARPMKIGGTNRVGYLVSDLESCVKKFAPAPTTPRDKKAQREAETA
jgi:hypothetical protein